MTDNRYGREPSAASASYFHDPGLIILDDAHAVENYVAKMWSLSNDDEISRQRLKERGQKILAQGLKDGSSFLIAKAVVALRANGVSPQEIVHQGLLYGATKTKEGWSSGVTILTIAANMWNEVDSADHNLFLVQGLSQIANKTAGRSSRRRQFPFPGHELTDLETLKRWFRKFIQQRDTDAAERILMTLHDRGLGKDVIGDFLFTAATDSYFTGGGHALDFANKTLEALDFIEWKDALEIVRPIAVDLVSRERHEEPNEILNEEFKGPEKMLARFQELADFQKVYDAELLVNGYLAGHHDEKALRRSLAHITVRENAELHMFQILEAAFAHCDLTNDPEEKRIHLLAATRYITAQKVMKRILWSTENAERLEQGESLSEREDNN